MAWFWRTRSPLEPDDEEWLLACWHWLSEKFPGAGLRSDRELVLPTGAFFSVATGDGHDAALHYFRQVASYLGVDPGQFELVAQEASVDAILGPMQIVENAPGGPAGTFSVDGERMIITYEPSLVNHPTELIATFAHELCHPLLFSIGEGPPGGEDMEEFATDLAVTNFGFGIFNCNTASQFRQYSDAATGTQGWSFKRQGYLSPAERAFALALFVIHDPAWQALARSHLDSGPAAYFRKALRYLKANPGVTDRSGA